jgi:1-acyl-sn-glycerol-3-phosphate acyltransferase
VLLPPRKRAPLERTLVWYARRLLRGAFDRIHVAGSLPARDVPLLAYANHASWWDPLATAWLARDVLKRESYGVMEGAGLLRFPFFRQLGLFGSTTATPADARALAACAAGLLRGPERPVVWIAPQGALLPPRVPLVFRSGAARIARAVPEAAVVPVALRYEFRAAQRPELFVRIGDAVPRLDGEAARALTRRLEDALRAELDALDADLLLPSIPPAYTIALRGRGTLDRLYDRTFGRWRGVAREEEEGDAASAD